LALVLALAIPAAANQAPGAAGQSYLDVVTAITKEWTTAKHANTKDPLGYAGVRGAICSPCHSGNSLQRWGSADPYVAAGIKSNPLATDKAYLEKDPKNANYTYMFDPHAADLPTPIDCAACHSGPGADILASGVLPGKLNVFASGFDWTAGKDALCFTCHNGRRNVADVYKSWTTPGATKARVYPHFGWDSLVTGKGGMEYPGVQYPQSTVHQQIGCVGCHMPQTEAGYVSHTFKPDLATCTPCHLGATEFTMGGNLKKELEEKAAELEKLVLAKIPGAVKIGTGHADSPAVDKDGKVIQPANIPAEALVGVYNLQIIKQELETGKGVHNPQYAKALLNESIKRLK
jgi:hypothetical protein